MQIRKIQQQSGVKSIHFSQFALNRETLRQNE